MIDKATVQKIIDAADIVEVVSDYVHLTKRGSNYMGLCPFHNEKTPSFSVSRNRNICHCFSCGKGGSPVNFIMEKEGINYHDALLHLADKYGIKVEERQQTNEERLRQSEREAMLVTNDWAMRHMQHNLTETEEGRNVGLQYLFQRGITMEAIKAFRLGYAIDRPDNLLKAAKAQGFEIDILQKTGLCGLSNSGDHYYDRFRSRVIFPVLNSAGKVIAFGGRDLKGSLSKYINSPESLLYRKSNELYGIYQARNSIVREKRCFLVEGYMDVIGMWQSGMENVVASSGTSLTEGQIALIHRFTDNVTLIYDGDNAGIKASLRGIDMLLAQKLNITVLLLPDGDDPDSFARKHTPEEFRNYVKENECDFIDFEINVLTGDANTPHAQAVAIQSVIRSVASVADPIQRQIYIQQCANRLNLSEELIISEVKKARISVLQELRKQRHREYIDRLEDSTNNNAQLQQSDDNKPNNENSKNSNQEEAESIDIPINDALIRLEENLLQYCVKYGMVTFCENIEEDREPNQWLTVAEFIQNEISNDKIEFSSPRTQLIFNEILAMAPAFRIAEQNNLYEIDATMEQRMKEWYEQQTDTFITQNEIESKEQEMRQQLDQERYNASRHFAIEYSARTLGSHPNDEVRQFALKAITPRYKLSRYHNKSANIQLEEDHIEELIIRSISEWKAGILARRYDNIQTQLLEASQAGDTQQVMECMSQLQHINTLRSQVAKTIGERILSPAAKR